MLVTAHLLLQHHVLNNPAEGLAVLPRRFRNYFENRRLQAPFSGSLTWRRLVNGPYTGDINVWTAPLECNGGPDPKLPDRYNVFLHHGYGLAQHKDTVRGLVDLEQAIDLVVPASGGGRIFELFYSAHLNETALAAVRADLGVDWVSCERNVHADMGWDSSSQLTDEEVKRMVESAERLDRLNEMATGDASEDERCLRGREVDAGAPLWDRANEGLVGNAPNPVNG